MSSVSYLEDEEEDQHDLDIKIKPQEYPDPNPTSIPNQKPKWAQNLIKAYGNVVGDPDDRRRMRSWYQNEHVVVSHTYPLLPERCFMMMGSYYSHSKSHSMIQDGRKLWMMILVFYMTIKLGILSLCFLGGS